MDWQEARRVDEVPSRLNRDGQAGLRGHRCPQAGLGSDGSLSRRRKNGAHQMKIKAAPLFLPRAGFPPPAAEIVHYERRSALVRSGKNNGGVAPNVSRQ